MRQIAPDEPKQSFADNCAPKTEFGNEGQLIITARDSFSRMPPRGVPTQSSVLTASSAVYFSAQQDGWKLAAGAGRGVVVGYLGRRDWKRFLAFGLQRVIHGRQILREQLLEFFHGVRELLF